MDAGDIKLIFQKNEKSLDELQLLKAYLNKLKFFQQIFDQYKHTPEMIFELCNQVKYEQYPQYRLVFQQGDTKIDKAYVILTGFVLISMKDNIDIFEKESESTNSQISANQQIQQSQLIQAKQKLKHQKHLSLMNKLISARLKGQIANQFLEEGDVDIKRLKISDEDYKEFIEKEYGQILVEQGSGSLFGEKALVENKPRAATVITKTDCEFLVVEKKDFELILNKFKKIQLAKNDFILQLFPFLGHLITSARVFERVVRFFIDENTFRNQILIKENSAIPKQNAKIFIIVHGEFKVFKVAKIRVERVNCLPHINISPIHICTLGRGEFFGEECVVQSEEFYQYSVSCISSFGQIYTLDKQLILKKLPEQIKELLMCSFKQKKIQRQTQFQENYEKVAQILNSNEFDVKQKYLKELSSKPVQIIKRDKYGRTIATINTDTSKLDQMINQESELIKLDHIQPQHMHQAQSSRNYNARSLSPIRTVPNSVENSNWLDQSDIIMENTKKTVTTGQQDTTPSKKLKKIDALDSVKEDNSEQEFDHSKSMVKNKEEDEAQDNDKLLNKIRQDNELNKKLVDFELQKLRKIANNDLSLSNRLVHSPMFNVSKNKDPYPFAQRNKDLIKQKFDQQMIKKGMKEKGIINDGNKIPQANSAKLNNIYNKILSVRYNQGYLINEVSFAFEKPINSSSLDKIKTMNTSAVSLKYKASGNNTIDKFPKMNRSLNSLKQTLPLLQSTEPITNIISEKQQQQSSSDQQTLPSTEQQVIDAQHTQQ